MHIYRENFRKKKKKKKKNNAKSDMAERDI